jgi:pyruvate dehydrogenase E2 component (dihydrolipoamide acetyltransferase)
MAVPIPLLVVAGEYMDSATVLQWLKQVGEPVREGDVLALVETAKATMEVVAPVSGVLVRTAFPVGADVPVGEVLGWIETAADPAAPPAIPQSAPERVMITPAARRLAAQLGVDPTGLRPSRPDGRITEADVRAAAPASSVAATSIPLDTPGSHAYTVDVPTPYRKTMAQRMVTSAGIPQFQLTVHVNLEALLQNRDRMGATRRPSFTAYLTKAVAEALQHHPRLNSTYDEGQLRLYTLTHIGVAVATEMGLAVPVVHDAAHLSVEDIDKQISELQNRTLFQRLRVEDVQGGTFTISNLGQVGVLQFAALVNPPQTAILAVGAIHPEPGGAGRGCFLTLSCDHRALDGIDGAEFLRTLRTVLENPPYKRIG